MDASGYKTTVDRRTASFIYHTCDIESIDYDNKVEKGEIMKPQPFRNGYGAIPRRKHEEIDGHLALVPNISSRTWATICSLVAAAGNTEHVDEHGSWEFGVELDNRGCGFAINWDVYGFGRDVHTHRMLRDSKNLYALNPSSIRFS